MISHIEPNTIQQIDPISKALSSLSTSALSLLVNGLDERIRQDLEALRHKYFAYLVAATVVVALGVILEEAEAWLRYVSRVLPLKEIAEYRLAKKLVKWGWMLIVIGVMGEGIFEVLVSRADALAHAFDDILVTDARKQAGDAKTSAESAKASAKEIGEQAAILEATTKRLIWEGPRDILLSDAEESFKPLRKFSGQKFRFSVCRSDFASGGMITSLGEVGRTEQAIFTQLRQAGWKPLATQTSLPYISDACASVSVSINPSKDATRSSRNAADALQSVLNQILSDDKGVGGLERFMSPDPGPEIIDIHVGAHPAQPAIKKHK